MSNSAEFRGEGAMLQGGLKRLCWAAVFRDQPGAMSVGKIIGCARVTPFTERNLGVLN